jgi:hypothetical protein
MISDTRSRSRSRSIEFVSIAAALRDAQSLDTEYDVLIRDYCIG